MSTSVLGVGFSFQFGPVSFALWWDLHSDRTIFSTFFSLFLSASSSVRRHHWYIRTLCPSVPHVDCHQPLVLQSVRSYSTSALWMSAHTHWPDSPHPGSPPSSSQGPGPLTSPGRWKRGILKAFCSFKKLHVNLKPRLTLNCLKFMHAYTNPGACPHLSESLQGCFFGI